MWDIWPLKYDRSFWQPCPNSWCVVLKPIPKDYLQVLHLLAHTLEFLPPVICLGADFHPLGAGGVSVVGTGLFFSSLQLLPSLGLLFAHAVPEGLHLWLALPPVLVLCHALLHCQVRSSTTRTGNELVQWIFFFLFLLYPSGPVMALRDWGWHPEESTDKV